MTAETDKHISVFSISETDKHISDIIDQFNEIKYNGNKLKDKVIKLYTLLQRAKALSHVACPLIKNSQKDICRELIEIGNELDQNLILGTPKPDWEKPLFIRIGVAFNNFLTLYAGNKQREHARKLEMLHGQELMKINARAGRYIPPAAIAENPDLGGLYGLSTVKKLEGELEEGDE